MLSGFACRGSRYGWRRLSDGHATSLRIRLRQGPVDQGAWNEFTRQYGLLILAWCQQCARDGNGDGW